MSTVRLIRPGLSALPIPLALLLSASALAQDEGAEGTAVQALDDFSDLAEEEPDAPETPQANDAAPSEAPETDPEIEAVLEEMNAVITTLDEDATRRGNMWEFSVDGTRLLAVTDTSAKRMRVISPIAEVENLPEDAMTRLMQANFDTALDARYAVGQGLVWAAFINPLDTLEPRDFASGVLQVKSLADTFGTTFSSGALNYGGGDSGAIIEDQLKELLEELEDQATT
ncbi:MAG: hypothetical protein ABJP70_06270 [Erythrobacter sp.]